IADGGPVTVTHPEMTRYFMTIPEAVRLILLAGATGRSGDVHVLKMGQPVKISDLAHDLIRLAAPIGHQIQIEYVGLRPGERLEEQLFAKSEHQEPTPFESLVVARNGGVDGGITQAAVRLEELAVGGESDELRAELFRG
ncbi:MAG TPA: polysaccharide biosynthesis protein, partial [Candidatus Limnocylindrales bacterium]|nr:polysaccharide biosynthesis protein [Candidatus Limnocylindrales bacterium]